jgi:hypothetical protein
MTGAHRQLDQNPVRAVLESVRWLLAQVGLAAAALAIVGVPVYLAITNWKLLSILTLAMQGLLTLVLARRLALKVLGNRAPSPVILADWIDDAAILIGVVATLIASIAQHQRWMHAAFEFTMLGILGLLTVGMPVFWWRGKRQLTRALTGHAVAGQWPWSATDAVS